MISYLRLQNGINLLFDHVAHSEIVSVGFYFLHGSRDETKEEYGHSHFLEHMLFKGTARRSAFEIARQVDKIGGVINGYTEKELTCFYATVPQKDVSLVFDLLFDITFNSLLDTHEFAKEMTVIHNEIKASEDSAEEDAHDFFLSELWNGHSLSKKIAGEIKDIEKITPAKLKQFYKKYYVVNNLIIAVAGCFEQKQIIDIIEANMAELKPNPYLNISRHAPHTKRSWKYRKTKFSQVQIYAGTVTYDFKNIEKNYTLLILSTIFGESMSSRLFQIIREEYGLCYTISSFRNHFSDSILWFIYCSTTPELCPQLIEALNKELSRLKNDPPAAEEIDDAKTHIIGGLVFTKQDMELRMRRLAKLFILMGKLFSFEEVINYIKSIDRQRVLEYINQVVRSDQFSLVACCEKRIKGFEKLMFDF